MRDTIYRDDAIRIASGYCHPANIVKELEKLPPAEPEPIKINIDHELTKDEYEKLRKVLANAPIVFQPERKTGRWIDAVLPNDNGGLPIQVCDQCNTFFPLAYTGGGHRFCPNCGAKMEVKHD